MYPDARTQRQSRTGTIAARQQGLGLPAAIFVILILALIAVAVTELEQSGVQAKTYEIMSTRAFFAAESGAQAAVHRLFPPGGRPAACTANFFSANYAVAGLNGCSSAVSCREDVANGVSHYTLRSTGSCNAGSGVDEVRRLVEVRVK